MAGKMPEALRKHFEAKEGGEKHEEKREERKEGKEKHMKARDKARKMKEMRGKKEAK